MKILDRSLCLKDFLGVLVIGGILYVLFGIANGNRFAVTPIVCSAAASLIFTCIVVWRYGIRLLTFGTISWIVFVIAYISCYFVNQLIGFIVQGNSIKPIGRLPVISLTIIIFSVLFAMLLWRTFSSHDFLDSSNQRQFMLCFKLIVFIMLVFYLAVILDFMFIRRFFAQENKRFLLLIPFGTIISQFFLLEMSGFEIFCQICGNLFLLTPIGFIVKANIFRVGDISRLTKGKINFSYLKKLSPRTKKIIYYALPFVISMLLEIMQYVFAVGYCDIDDIILNSLGYFLGTLIVTVCNRIRKAKTHGLDKNILAIVK